MPEPRWPDDYALLKITALGPPEPFTSRGIRRSEPQALVIDDPETARTITEAIEKFKAQHQNFLYQIINLQTHRLLHILDGPEGLHERMIEDLLGAGRPILDFYPGRFCEFPLGVVPEGVTVEYAVPPKQPIDDDLTLYVLNHYSHLWMEQEQQAYSRSGIHMRGGPYGPERVSLASLSDNETVRELGALDQQEIVNRVVLRILTEHQREVYLNHCPECGKLCRTPRSRQCRHCHFDWH